MIFDEFTLKSQIRAVPDFPKPGVVFRDITRCSSRRAAHDRGQLRPALHRGRFQPHRRHGCPRLPHRLGGGLCAEQAAGPVPRGKLPADVLAEGYQTEYGEAFLEVHADSLCEGDSVLIFDDLIATGGPAGGREPGTTPRGQGLRGRGDHRPAGTRRLHSPAGRRHLHLQSHRVRSRRALIRRGRPGAPRSLLAPHLPSGRADLAINDFEMARNDLPLLDNPAIITSANDTFRGVIANSP